MYTENKPYKSVFIKILLVALALFVLMILFPTKGFVTNYVDKKLGNSSDNFNNNLIALASVGSGYYNSSRLPKEEGEKSKLTLKEMLDKKMIVNLTDSNGNTCSKNKSYVLVTKEKDEYTMKVNLSCEDKTDYIILHMDLNGTQFPSTSTARCKFVKNLDEVWSYGEWSNWSTNKVVEDSTIQVEKSSRKIQTGTEVKTRNQVESKNATRYVYNGVKAYYVCSSAYDNAGTYEVPTVCNKTTVVSYEQPAYKWVTYYRYRTKKLENSNQDIKEAECDNVSLINEGYTKVEN